MSARIAVWGATGTTGARIVRELAGGGVELVVCGRDAARLDALAAALPRPPVVRVTPPGDAGALAAALRGATVVVAAAGPFATLGEPVLAAAIAAGAHYVDVAPEQAFLRAAYERHEAEARRAGVCAIPGMGVDAALGDLAGRWAAEAIVGPADADGRDPVRSELPPELAADEPLDELAITHVLDGFVPTPGSQRSAIAALAAPGVVWRHDRWDPVPPGGERRRVDAGPALGERDAVLLPAGEVITLPRHVAARRIATYVSLTRHGWLARATGLAARAAPWLAGTLRGRLDGWVDEVGPDERARAAARFAVIAEARRGPDAARVVVAGRDVYATTSRIAAWAAAALARRARGPVGVLAPSEAFGARAALAALAAAADLEVTPSFAAP